VILCTGFFVLIQIYDLEKDPHDAKCTVAKKVAAKALHYHLSLHPYADCSHPWTYQHRLQHGHWSLFIGMLI